MATFARYLDRTLVNLSVSHDTGPTEVFTATVTDFNTDTFFRAISLSFNMYRFTIKRAIRTESATIMDCDRYLVEVLA